MTGLFRLKDRERLMALIFAIRLFVLSLAFVVLSLGVFSFQITESREMEALFVLYSVFQMLISLVLLFLRFSANLQRLLLLGPLICLVFRTYPAFFAGLAAGGFLLLEAFRRESATVGTGVEFGRCQAYLLMAVTTLLLTPREHFLSMFICFLLVSVLLVALACHKWQKAIRRTLESLDLDREIQS